MHLHFLKFFSAVRSYNDSLLLMKWLRNHYHPLNTRVELVKTRYFGQFTSTSENISIENTKNVLKDKIDKLVKRYEEITGMDEVRFMQNRVIDAQNKLVEAQEKRREATKSLSVIQNKLKDIHSELDTTAKGEERYLHLITQEHAVLKEERICNIRFQLCEKEERDCFAFLSSTVKESHEKERAQAERTKYWSVIGSIIGTIIGVIGSSINNEFKMKELRRLVKVSVEDHTENLLSQRREILALASELRESANKKPMNNEVIDEIVLHNLSNYQQDNSLEKLLLKQKQEIRIVTVIAIVVPVICLIIQKLS